LIEKTQKDFAIFLSILFIKIKDIDFELIT